MKLLQSLKQMKPTDRGLLVVACILFWPVTATAVILFILCQGISFLNAVISKHLLAAKDIAEREQEPLQLQRDALRQQKYQIELDARCEERKQEARRRQAAQARVEFLFSLYEPELKERFPRKQFQKHMETFLGAGHSVTDVERYADTLEGLIHKHHEMTNPSATAQTIQALKRSYDRRTAEIAEATQGDADEDDLRESFLAHLKEQYQEQMQQLIGRLTP